MLFFLPLLPSSSPLSHSTDLCSPNPCTNAIDSCLTCNTTTGQCTVELEDGTSCGDAGETCLNAICVAPNDCGVALNNMTLRSVDGTVIQTPPSLDFPIYSIILELTDSTFSYPELNCRGTLQYLGSTCLNGCTEAECTYHYEETYTEESDCLITGVTTFDLVLEQASEPRQWSFNWSSSNLATVLTAMMEEEPLSLFLNITEATFSPAGDRVEVYFDMATNRGGFLVGGIASVDVCQVFIFFLSYKHQHSLFFCVVVVNVNWCCFCGWCVRWLWGYPQKKRGARLLGVWRGVVGMEGQGRRGEGIGSRGKLGVKTRKKKTKKKT